MKLSFITPVAYDWRYALRAIKSYYDIADEIILGLDRRFISWSGKPFEFDMDAFTREIAWLDKGHKIRLVRDNFYSPYDFPLENDTAERNVLASFATGDWLVSIDSDEILLNPFAFAEWLEYPKPENVQVSARLMTVFKTFGDVALMIAPPYEAAFVATRAREFEKARVTKEPTHVQSVASILHYGWGRTRDEVKQKLENWGHSQDFDTKGFLSFWDSVTLENYKDFKNFHPLRPELWSALEARKNIDAGT